MISVVELKKNNFYEKLNGLPIYTLSQIIKVLRKCQTYYFFLLFPAVFCKGKLKSATPMGHQKPAEVFTFTNELNADILVDFLKC